MLEDNKIVELTEEGLEKIRGGKCMCLFKYYPRRIQYM